MNDTLLQDLVMYKKSKDKGVMMAAKGLLSLYREVGAEMLKKRDRGKDAAIGLRTGEQKRRRFGEEMIGEIEGLDLLEKWKMEERQRKRQEKGLPTEGSDGEESDEEELWGAWDVQEEDSDDSGGWIDVESDAEINISDDEDEKPAMKKIKLDLDDAGIEDIENQATSEEPPAVKTSSLATSRILTPADLAKLHELRTSAAVSSLANKRKSHHLGAQHQRSLTNSHRHMDDPLTSAEIEGLAALSRGKLSRLEKAKLLEESRTDRAEHKSKAARKQERKRDEGKSTTNKEKARKKNFLMTLGKAKRKGKRSLVETRKVLKMHQERAKRGGKRGNR
jgi:protein SDA1